MKIRILDLTIQDLEKGRNFYEKQQQDLGEYFLDSMFADIESLQLYMGIHSQYLGYYRLLAKRFPYAIYYKVVEMEIQIWRILDCRAQPTVEL
ncbi:type II toxin-antitoxin system RelE/ParE family toxin [Acinetobacter haemolyticus]|uniref:type II toxin-antitoxin system RelE/ParE family toxin n=1 Tax=Acinetobacter haemolyticus TaxID=29430 RepID=UPI0002F81572|nr:type II toxin-antitoxin system RelE/ParE family toxin [Acinetobacter haemolyticus]